jgi:FMN phosphatase YigB (HAD superfamily)
VKLISTILFDLCDAIIPRSFSGIADALAERGGQSVAEVLTAFSSPEANDLRKGNITEDAYFGSVIERAKWTRTSVIEVKGLLRAMFREEQPHMHDFIGELAPRFSMVLVSDIAEEWSESIPALHPWITEVFQTRIFSWQHRLLKRDHSSFLQMISLRRIDLNSCLLIDDSNRNIEATNASRIHSILFKYPAQCCTDLERLGLLSSQTL